MISFLSQRTHKQARTFDAIKESDIFLCFLRMLYAVLLCCRARQGCLLTAKSKLLKLSNGRCTYFWEHDIAVMCEIDFFLLIFYCGRTIQD